MKVFISTIGKVGSSSLRDAFKKAGYKSIGDDVKSLPKLLNNKADAVVHTHNLNYTCYAVNQAVSRDHKCLVFVGSRDVLRRHISAFFQNVDNATNRFWYLPNWAGLSIEELHQEFERRVVIHIDEVAGEWLLNFTQKNSIPDSILKQKLEETRLKGVSSFNNPVYKHKVTYVFYQLEKLNSNWSMIKDIVSSSRFPSVPPKSNEATSKKISTTYRNFVSTYTPTPLVLKKSYDCDISGFYTSDEINQQIEAWSVK